MRNGLVVLLVWTLLLWLNVKFPKLPSREKKRKRNALGVNRPLDGNNSHPEDLTYLERKSIGLFIPSPTIRRQTQPDIFANVSFVLLSGFSGVQALVFQVAKLRAKVNWRFMSYGMQVLGATVNEKEGSFCLHFRLSGVPFKWRRALQFWKWMPWSYKKSSNHSAE